MLVNMQTQVDPYSPGPIPQNLTSSKRKSMSELSDNGTEMSDAASEVYLLVEKIQVENERKRSQSSRK